LNYTYIIECSDGSLYCGWTNDIKKRILAHNEGRGAKYTRGRGPVRLVHMEEYDTKEEAMSREFYIKKLSRIKKEELIHEDGRDYDKFLTENDNDGSSNA